MVKRFEGENQRQNQFDISICPGMILLIPVDASLFISGIMGRISNETSEVTASVTLR